MRSTFRRNALIAISLLAVLNLQCSDSPNEPIPDSRILSLSAYDWEAPVAGGTSPVIEIFDSSVTGEFQWTATVQYYYYGVDGTDWLQISADSGTTPGQFTLTVTPNHRYYHRTARVIVDAPGINGSPDTFSVIQNITFAPPVNYTVGTEPRAIVSADFNGDGHRDLATANFSSNNVSVLLSSGDGSFETAANYGVGEMPLTVFPSDLNDDGAVDLITADIASECFSVLFNNGDGTFQTAVSHDAGKIMSVVAADFDRDGDNDLAVTAYPPESFPLYDGTVSIWFNDGNGGFEAGEELFGEQAILAASADFNLDFHIDLAVISGSMVDNVQLYLNDGSGAFDAFGSYSLNDYAQAACARDLDMDGYADLAITKGCYCCVLLNNGDASFQQPVSYLAEYGIEGVCAADFDIDGDVDLGIADYAHDCAIVLRNTGDGTFGDFRERDYYSVGDVPVYDFGDPGHQSDAPRSICTADFDGDGDRDIAVANAGSGTVSVIINNWIQ